MIVNYDRKTFIVQATGVLPYSITPNQQLPALQTKFLNIGCRWQFFNDGKLFDDETFQVVEKCQFNDDFPAYVKNVKKNI
jgi:hypothetical protein